MLQQQQLKAGAAAAALVPDKLAYGGWNEDQGFAAHSSCKDSSSRHSNSRPTQQQLATGEGAA